MGTRIVRLGATGAFVSLGCHARFPVGAIIVGFVLLVASRTVKRVDHRGAGMLFPSGSLYRGTAVTIEGGGIPPSWSGT